MLTLPRISVKLGAHFWAGLLGRTGFTQSIRAPLILECRALGPSRCSHKYKLLLLSLCASQVSFPSYLGTEPNGLQWTAASLASPSIRTARSTQFNICAFSNVLHFFFLQSAPAQGAQKLVGYKGSTMPGSAPPRRDGKPGVVYRLKVGENAITLWCSSWKGSVMSVTTGFRC